MKYILIINIFLLLESSNQSGNSPYAFKSSEHISISFEENLDHSENIKVKLDKLLPKYNPDEIYSLELLNVLNGEIFTNGSFNAFQGLFQLEIRDSRINYFPESILEGLKELKVLIFSNISLKSVTANLFKFTPELIYLGLNDNELEELLADTFEHLTEIRQIDLTSNKLKTLPKGIFHRSRQEKVARVFLADNNLTKLEEDVFQTENLELLTLSGNHVRHIDNNTFKNLYELESLNMTATFTAEVDRLPKALFSNSSNLKYLQMDKNHFQFLEVGIFHNLRQLKVLDLSFNKLKDLDDDIFKNNIHLETLHLSNNKLKNLSKNIFKDLQELTKLDLSNNQLTNLDPEIFLGLTHLSILNISYNTVNLAAVGNYSVLKNCSNLIEIHATNNNISKIFIDWRRNGKLWKLNLKNNPLPSSEIKMSPKFPGVEFHFTSHDSINVRFDNKSIGSLTRHAIDTGILDKNQKCQETESGCSCIYVMDHDLKKITLECRRFNIDELDKWPKDFIPSASNKSNFTIELLLSNCNLSSTFPISKYLEDVTVTKLVLSSNKLTSLSDLPSNLPALEVLELHDNKFSSLNEHDVDKLWGFKKLQNITFHQNPWNCTTCDLKYFYEFLKSHKEKIPDSEKVLCHDGKLLVKSYDIKNCSTGISEEIVHAVLAIVGCAVGISIILWIYHRFMDIKVYIYNHREFFPRWVFPQEEDNDSSTTYKYDAFVCYAKEDEKFIKTRLRPMLEDTEPKFKLCIHQRDWCPGHLIHDQIYKSVADSRRTIIVLSHNFLNSNLCNLEFQVAYDQSIRDKVNRLLVIMLEDIAIHRLSNQLKAYITKYTYIPWQDNDWFWNKLRYVLPHKNKVPAKNERTRISSNEMPEDPIGDSNNEQSQMIPLPQSLRND
ncbi:hypothetical protein V9T40_011020 [Parthenolecanium corni]|uniref:TIR domain-containing protein n=1 Tax=Parthenolecanium corni TaxID=536013 RepID=A0AAN9T637_9HEMI